MGKKKEVFKILSIDGGGILGLFSAIVLNEIEKSNGKINDYFDMICGTSTGGLIALALGADIHIQKVIDLYCKNGPEIFSSNKFSRPFLLLKQIFISSKYTNKKLKRLLSEIFNNRLLDDSINCLCIPAVNLTNFKGIVLKTSHQSHLNRDSDIRMLDVALATSAAPTYFPIVSVENVSSKCVDGGLWANNPSLVGIIEALSYFVGKDKPYNKMDLLSVGNIINEEGWIKRRRNASIFTWKHRLVTLPLSTQSRSVEELLKITYSKNLFHLRNYERIFADRVPDECKKIIKMDRADKTSIEAIKDIAQNSANEWKNKDKIKSFFQEKKDEWNFPINNIKE